LLGSRAAFGISEDVIDELIRDGLVAAEPKLSFAERRAVRRLNITAAGRVALER